MDLTDFQEIQTYQNKMILLYDGAGRARLLYEGNSEKLKVALAQMFQQKPELKKYFQEIFDLAEKSKIILDT